MTTYYGPGAAGSGVAELVGYVNGINYPNFISIPTMLTKIVGTTFAVVGRLCVGKEGPLAHIGAICGILVLYIPGQGFEYLRNDEYKRQMVAAGASAGVSVAFGAPIGGTLFSYEMSRPNTFWRFSMIWKVFMSCSVATFYFAFLNNTWNGNLGGSWSGSALKFGQAKSSEDVNLLYLLPASVILGIIGGCLGSVFISVNTKVNAIRKVWLTKKWVKPIETFMWCFLTASFFFFSPRFSKTCENFVIGAKDKIDYEENHKISETLFKGWCSQTNENKLDKDYDVLATLFWNTEGGVIRLIMNRGVEGSFAIYLTFILVWYFFTITTYGTNVPSGLFLPGMIIGCVLGAIYTEA